jgi:hypothetical protein
LTTVRARKFLTLKGILIIKIHPPHFKDKECKVQRSYTSKITELDGRGLRAEIKFWTPLPDPLPLYYLEVTKASKDQRKIFLW